MFISLGFVTVPNPGTPVSVTVNGDDPAANPGNLTHVQSIIIEALAGNTGKVYVGNSPTFNKTTGVGVIGIIVAPSSVLPSWAAASPGGQNAIALNQIYIDTDNPGEGALVSAMVV